MRNKLEKIVKSGGKLTLVEPSALHLAMWASSEESDVFGRLNADSIAICRKLY